MEHESQPGVPHKAALSAVFNHDIADQLKECFASFKRLISCQALELPEYNSQVKHNLWSDELGRLRIWGAKIGAHKRDVTSLDFRLRDASHVSSQIVQLLKGLHNLLVDVIALCEQEDKEHDPENALLEDESSLDGLSELQELYESIVVRIDNLFEMTLVVRKPAKLNRITSIGKLRWGPSTDFDLMYVQHKFPVASKQLQENLTAALTMRRAVLEYYDIHRYKYARRIDATSDEDTPQESEPAESIAPATEYNPKSILYEDTRSQSEDSVQSTRSLMDPKRPLHIPIPEEIHRKRPYPCPYCHYLLDIYNPRQYTRHVFEDITPYQCVFTWCTHNHELLASKSAWLQHMHQAHSALWIEASQKQCFMCGQETFAEKKFDKHIARHLEDLAIFVLPSLDDEDESNVADAKTATDEEHITEHDDERSTIVEHPPDGTSIQWLFAVGDELNGSFASASVPTDVQPRYQSSRDPSRGGKDDYVVDLATLPSNNFSSGWLEDKWSNTHYDDYDGHDSDNNSIEIISEHEYRGRDQAMRSFMQSEAAETKAAYNSPPKRKAPIRFKDGLGRNLHIPWHRCCKWENMERLINQAFAHVDKIGPHVMHGHYDLIGPDKEIIMPDFWEDTIQPGMSITMMLWPLPESETEPELELEPKPDLLLNRTAPTNKDSKSKNKDTEVASQEQSGRPECPPTGN